MRQSINLIKRIPDLTHLGWFLRWTSLDELPEFVNVPRGEMSLFSPRPLPMEYLDRHTPKQARRHKVKPGITGWTQVNGCNSLSWKEKFKLDVRYVDHWSRWLDIKILFLTAIKVFKREDISAEGHAPYQSSKEVLEGMNVLLTSVGQRTTLIQAFKNAVKKRGGEMLAGLPVTEMASPRPSTWRTKPFAFQGFLSPSISNTYWILLNPRVSGSSSRRSTPNFLFLPKRPPIYRLKLYDAHLFGKIDIYCR